MMGPHHVPLGEGLDAIGQWGTLVGAFFAIIASFVKVYIDKKQAPSREPPRRVWPIANIDLEANNGAVSHGHALGSITAANDDVPRTGHYDFGQVFKEGAWWGHKLDGTRIPNEGIVWIVQDGKLQLVKEPPQ